MRLSRTCSLAGWKMVEQTFVRRDAGPAKVAIVSKRKPFHVGSSRTVLLCRGIRCGSLSKAILFHSSCYAVINNDCQILYTLIPHGNVR